MKQERSPHYAASCFGMEGFMKIGEARTVYNRYYNQLTDRYSKLKKQAEKEQAAGNEEQAGVMLELSQKVLDKRDTICQFARFDIPELIANMENEKLLPQQTEAMKECAEDLAKIMEVARRIASGAKVPPEDEKKLMEYNADLYQAVKNAEMLAKAKEKKEYDSLWGDEKDPENMSFEEIQSEVLDSELDMDLPEIDMSLVESESE